MYRRAEKISKKIRPPDIIAEAVWQDTGEWNSAELVRMCHRETLNDQSDNLKLPH